MSSDTEPVTSEPMPSATAPKPASTMTILASRRDRLGLGAGLPKSRFPFLLPRLRRRVCVEDNVVADNMFYVPFSNENYTPAQVVRGSAAGDGVVKRGEGFTISYVGLSVQPEDWWIGNRNEILMYSLQQGKCAHVKEVAEDSGGSGQVEHGMAPTGLMGGNDFVKIHFDPLMDGHNEGTEPDRFEPVPAGKSVYKSVGEGEEVEKIRVRFSVLEIDKVSDLTARAIGGVDQVGSYVSKTAAAVPYAELVGKTFAVASELGRKGLKKYAQPDHVMSRDVRFWIGGEGWGDYLRFGYYVFLSDDVRARLYLQTGTSGQKMPLFLRRVGKRGKREVEFMPLTGVSYVVMKVEPGGGEGCGRGDRKRLENILQINSAIETLLRGKDGGGVRGMFSRG